MRKLSNSKDRALVELGQRETAERPSAVEYDAYMVVTVPAYAIDPEKHAYAADLSVISFRFRAYPGVYYQFSSKMQEVCYPEFAQNSQFIREVFKLSYARFQKSRAYFVGQMTMTAHYKQYLDMYDDTVKYLTEKQLIAWKRDFTARSTRDKPAQASWPDAASATYNMGYQACRTIERRIIAKPAQRLSQSRYSLRETHGKQLAPFEFKPKERLDRDCRHPEEKIESRPPVYVAYEYADVKTKYMMPRAAIQAPAYEIYAFSPQINRSSTRLAKSKRQRDAKRQEEEFYRYTERFSYETQKPDLRLPDSCADKNLHSSQSAEDEKTRSKAEAVIKLLESKYGFVQ